MSIDRSKIIIFDYRIAEWTELRLNHRAKSLEGVLNHPTEIGSIVRHKRIFILAYRNIL